MKNRILNFFTPNKPAGDYGLYFVVRILFGNMPVNEIHRKVENQIGYRVYFNNGDWWDLQYNFNI